jgi:pyruvate dehydrogenase E2 component (dihydrolipoamide acetyltransferase)
MAELLRMPAVDAGAASAVLSGWPLAEGAAFGQGDPIVVVETDKAEVEIGAEQDGTLLKTLVPTGSEVEVGSPIAVIAAVGETVADLGTVLAELGAATVSEPTMAARRDVPETPGTVAPAEIPGAVAPTSSVPIPVTPPEPEPVTPPDSVRERGGRVFASPLARRLAKEAGVPVQALNGTGPGGRIVRRDVEEAVAARRAEAPISAAATGTRNNLQEAPAQPARPVAPAVASAEYEDVPHTRMRLSIAARLTESKRTAPHFYLRATCTADGLLLLRQQINETSTVKVSVNDLLVKAVARAHVMVPEMNVIWTADAVRRFTSVDISVAIATDRGLVTPVVRGVQARSVTDVAGVVRDFADKAKGGGLQQSDLEGGSITITNLGMYGVEEFAAIINPPQSAILAVGAAREEPVVTGGRIEVAKVIRLVLSVDHRPIDGALAARWMKALTSMVENPLQILV